MNPSDSAPTVGVPWVQKLMSRVTENSVSTIKFDRVFLKIYER